MVSSISAVVVLCWLQSPGMRLDKSARACCAYIAWSML